MADESQSNVKLCRRATCFLHHLHIRLFSENEIHFPSEHSPTAPNGTTIVHVLIDTGIVVCRTCGKLQFLVLFCIRHQWFSAGLIQCRLTFSNVTHGTGECSHCVGGKWQWKKIIIIAVPLTRFNLLLLLISKSFLKHNRKIAMHPFGLLYHYRWHLALSNEKLETTPIPYGSIARFRKH